MSVNRLSFTLFLDYRTDLEEKKEERKGQDW